MEFSLFINVFIIANMFLIAILVNFNKVDVVRVFQAGPLPQMVSSASQLLLALRDSDQAALNMSKYFPSSKVNPQFLSHKAIYICHLSYSNALKLHLD